MMRIKPSKELKKVKKGDGLECHCKNEIKYIKNDALKY
jgi:hypothetical protein